MNNIFAQQKQQNYPSSEGTQQVEQPAQGTEQKTESGLAPTQESLAFAAGKQAANSQRQLDMPVSSVTNVGDRPIQNPNIARQPTKYQSAFKPVNPNSATDGINSVLPYTTPEQEEKYRKASVQRQRVLAVADALRNIGNLWGATKGAVPQTFNNPVEAERARYYQEKAMRDKDNYRFMTYQQAKAAQDLRKRQLEQQHNQWFADYQLKVDNAKSQSDLRNAQIARQEALAELDKARKEGIITQNQYHELRNKYYPLLQDANLAKTKAQTNAANVSAYNNTRRTDAYVEDKKNGGSNKTPTTLYSRRGYLTKNVGSNDNMENIIDAMYNWGKDPKRGYINEKNVLAGIAPNVLGGKSISYQAKQEAVNKMLMEHDDAAVQLHSKHGFVWHEQKPNDKKTKANPYGGTRTNTGGASKSSNNGENKQQGHSFSTIK